MELHPTAYLKVGSYFFADPKGPGKNNYPFLDADPSRLPALLAAFRSEPVERRARACQRPNWKNAHISRYYSLLAPCHTGASTPKNGHLFLPGPLGSGN